MNQTGTTQFFQMEGQGGGRHIQGPDDLPGRQALRPCLDQQAKDCNDAAPAATISASTHFEAAIATAVMLFGLSSSSVLATVVGVLIEVPLMLMLVEVRMRSTHWFALA